jgi:ferrous iron transport protein B
MESAVKYSSYKTDFSDNDEKVIAIAGNPNVGKSTVFNSLTHMHQHTGNWPGKTVANATGYCSTKKYNYKMIDIPGTYSLMAHSAEEEIARDFLCFGNPDGVVVICDATCLERNLNLVLQTLEITSNVIVCVNLMDEAKKKGIEIKLDVLSEALGVPVIGMVARDGKGISSLLSALDNMMAVKMIEPKKQAISVTYSEIVEKAILHLEPAVEEELQHEGDTPLNTRWLSLRLLDYDHALKEGVKQYLGREISESSEVKERLSGACDMLEEQGIDKMNLEEEIVSSVIKTAEDISEKVVIFTKEKKDEKDRKLDQILTSKRMGYPIMIILLLVVLWVTIVGANYPSRMLSEGLFNIQDYLTELFMYFGAPAWLHGILILGLYRVLAWVISVMLPPMAIFFPLFTLLEDAGYLPRIAYNLDKPFKKCCACGKQALTMCMGCAHL